MSVKHATLPAGVDQPGFTGITPTLYAEEHAFTGGAQGSILIRDTVDAYGMEWVASAAGVLVSSGADQTPAFTTTLPNAVQDNITRLGTIANGTVPWANVSKSGSSLADLATISASALSSGTLPDARFPATLPAISGVALTALNATALGSGTVPDARFPSTLPALNGSNLTALNATNLASGTVAAGRFPATLPAVSGANLTALNASALASGTVADARLSSNVPLEDAANVFALADTGVGSRTLSQIFSRTGASTSATERRVGIAFRDGNNTTIVGGIEGVRLNSTGNFLGGLAFSVHADPSGAATAFTDLTEVLQLFSDSRAVFTGTLAWGGGSAIASSDSVMKMVAVGTNTITAAAAAMSNGDVLVLNKGTYTQTAAITIPAGVTSFSIIGQGQGCTIINYTTNDVNGITSSDIDGDDANRILRAYLAGFTMQYSVGAGASTAVGIQLWGHEYDSSEQVCIRLENIGIRYGSVNNCWITAVRLINARVAVLDNLYIRRTASSRTGTGILLESCMNCRIVNSFVMSTSSAISLTKATDSLIFNATKHGCEDITVANTSCYIFGIGINLGYKCFSSKLLGVELARPSTTAIYEDVTSGTENGGYHMIDNVYVDMDGNMAGSHAFHMGRPGSVVRGCQITIGDFAVNGITFAGAADKCLAIGNVLRSSGFGGAQGIWMDSNVCSAISNMFEDSAGSGADILISGDNGLVALNMVDSSVSNTGTSNTIGTNPVH